MTIINNRPVFFYERWPMDAKLLTAKADDQLLRLSELGGVVFENPDSNLYFNTDTYQWELRKRKARSEKERLSNWETMVLEWRKQEKLNREKDGVRQDTLDSIEAYRQYAKKRGLSALHVKIVIQDMLKQIRDLN